MFIYRCVCVYIYMYVLTFSQYRQDSSRKVLSWEKNCLQVLKIPYRAWNHKIISIGIIGLSSPTINTALPGPH